VGCKVSGFEALDNGDDPELDGVDENERFMRSSVRISGTLQSHVEIRNGRVGDENVSPPAGDAGLKGEFVYDPVGVSFRAAYLMSCVDLFAISHLRYSCMQTTRLIRSCISDRSLIKRSSSKRNVCGTISDDFDGSVKFTKAFMKS
jgi:hypothetical protein